MPTSRTIELLLARYGGATPDMLNRVLTPYRLQITEISIPTSGGSGGFIAAAPRDIWTALEDGTTGKVVPKEHVEDGAPWREVIKARIRETRAGQLHGELYFSPNRLSAALRAVKVGDYIEIDPFGVASKIESALCEAAFFQAALERGYSVTRMPENVAKHVGTQNYYDFKLEREKCIYRVELKSLWGTDTTKARLIHTVSREGGGKNSARSDRQVWATSSCRFKDQDIFAVSMWLRTGRVSDFAYALSVPDTVSQEWGLPMVPKHPDHVTQNPNVSDPPSGAWTMDLNEVCFRRDTLRSDKSRC